MVSKHPWFEQRWLRSDQPDVIRVNKRALRFASLAEYGKDAVTITLSLPFIAAGWALTPSLRHKKKSPRDMMGVAVTPFTPHDDALPELVSELGIRHLLLRVPVWDRARFPEYVQFMQRFTGREWLIAIVQNRESICQPERWRNDLRNIFSTFGHYATHFQLPLAPNRTKWGCAHMGEALDLLEHAELVRKDFPHLKLVGPGIIDFEPATWIRGLMNRRRFQLDAAGALLYVDRRGAPTNTQYGFFDLKNKLRLWKAVMAASPRCRFRGQTPLFITEFNWPLCDSGEYGPTSEDEEINEDDAARHLADYFRIALQSGYVERAYFWQLVQRGYGLIDDRDGTLRRRPGFYAVKELLSA